MKKKQLLNISDFLFLSKNVKGLKASEKQLKTFQFFNKKISLKGVFFLQESHS